MASLSNNSSCAHIPARSLSEAGQEYVFVLRSFALCLLLLFASVFSGRAQFTYNRLYTLASRLSSFYAVAPYGAAGGCMTAAMVIDSSSGLQAIRIARVDAAGNIESSHYFNVPDDTARTLIPNYKAMAKVHDNCYAIVGTVLARSRQYGFILLSDSNGQVFRYRDLIFKDTTFNYVSDVKYDGQGHLIAAGHYYTDNKTSDSSYGVIYKLDTSLNLFWSKRYHPGSILRFPAIFCLAVDSSGYSLGGGAKTRGFNSDKGYRSQSLLVKTDTAGNQKWAWSSPIAGYSACQSDIPTVLHTLDGGYLYTAKGHTYNRYLPSDIVIQLEAKQLIVKLDTSRNKQWEVEVDDYYSGLGYVPASLIEFSDSTFLFLGSRTTDSLSPDLKIGKLVLQLYSNKGVLLKQRIINKYSPRSAADTHKESGGPIYDIRQTADKGLVLCGYYENRTAGAPAPTMRSWLLKLDSNWCLGAGDSQCIPSAIIELPAASAEAFVLHPNPNNGTCVLRCTAWSGTLSGAEIQLFDLSGRTLLQQTLREAETRLDLRSFSSGMYFCQISQNGKLLYHGKLIKQ